MRKRGRVGGAIGAGCNSRRRDQRQRHQLLWGTHSCTYHPSSSPANPWLLFSTFLNPQTCCSVHCGRSPKHMHEQRAYGSEVAHHELFYLFSRCLPQQFSAITQPCRPGPAPAPLLPCSPAPLLPCSSPTAPAASACVNLVLDPHKGGRSGACGAAALGGVALGCPSVPASWSAEAHFLRGWSDL